MTSWHSILLLILGAVTLTVAWRWHTRAMRVERSKRKALRRSNRKWMNKQQRYLSQQRRTH